MAAAEAERSGTLVIEAKGVGKSYERPVVAEFSTRIERGDRIGIVGPNGSGKTTLVNLLTGALAPDAGTVQLGANLAMATLDQHRESLNPDWTVTEALTGGRGDTVMIGGQARHVVGYLRDFLFAPEQARTPLRVLSGGERGRLMLARALAKPSNLLVLDEPTNDLDLETLDVLEEMIGDYSGTVLLISHDRDFLDRCRQCRAGSGGQRQMGRICRRLFRHARAARRGCAQAAAAKPAAAPAKPKAARPAADARRSASSTSTKSTRWKRCRTAWRRWRPRSGGCSDKLADPQLYARDRAAFDKTSKALAAAQAELSAAEERWLELELLRAQIEGP